MIIERNACIAAALVVGGLIGAVGLSGCASDSLHVVARSAIPASFAGQWSAASDGGETSITFNENGEFVGFDGCNSHNGTYRVSDSIVTLGFSGATEIACSKDVWLAKVTSAYLDGDSLVMTDSAGMQLGELNKTAR